MSKTAFIGLCAMGSRMAANLLKAGHEVTVCDLVPEAVKKLADSGAKTAASAREAAEGNEFVLTMVRDDEVSRKVWLNYTVKAAGGDASVPTVSATRDVFQKAIDEKLGDLNMTTVVKPFEKNN